MSETTETTNLVIDGVDKYDFKFSWNRRISFTYNNHKIKNATLSFEDEEGYELSRLSDRSAAILGDLSRDDDFLQELDALSYEKQCANLLLELHEAARD